MVGIPDPVLLIFPSTCIDTLVPGYSRKIDATTPDLGPDEEIEHGADLALASMGSGLSAAEIALVSASVPEGELATDVGSGLGTAELEAGLGPAGAVLASASMGNGLGTEEIAPASVPAPEGELASDTGSGSETAELETGLGSGGGGFGVGVDGEWCVRSGDCANVGLGTVLGGFGVGIDGEGRTWPS
jgi:hypothetical protein